MLQVVSVTSVLDPMIKKPPPCRKNGARFQKVQGKCFQRGDGRNFREMAGARVLVVCSGFGACAHAVGRLVRVDVAGGQCDLRAGPHDKEAAALPEK
jgi:hypothetical protein